MSSEVRPELPTASVGSSQAPTAAVDNSAPFSNRPQSTYKSGKAVQTNGATSPAQGLTGLHDVPAHDFSIHVIWMVEAGLLLAHVNEMQSGEPAAVLVLRLTWQGCEFADAVMNDTLWAKAKESVIKPSASWTFGLLTEWLKAEITQGFPTLRRQP